MTTASSEPNGGFDPREFFDQPKPRRLANWWGLRNGKSPVRDAAEDYRFARMSLGGYLEMLAPSPERASDELRRRVVELADAQALDEGSGEVFDPAISAWVEQWSNRVDAQHHARQNVLHQRETAAEADIEWHRQRVRWTERELAEVDNELLSLRDGRIPDQRI